MIFGIKMEKEKLKGREKLEELVIAEENLHDKQLNAVLRFFDKNQKVLCRKTLINGETFYSPPEEIVPDYVYESRLKNKKYYRYPGIAFIMKARGKKLTETIPENWELIDYIPKTKGFIKVMCSNEIKDNVLYRRYHDMRKMTKNEIKPYFKFYNCAIHLIKYDSKAINSIRYTAYLFRKQ